MTNTRSLADLQQEISQLDDRYVLQRIIGAGSYGMVIRAKDTADGDRYVAIKRVNKEIFDEVVLAKRILREIQLLAHFNDENIIGLRNILTPKDPEGFDHFYIVMDIMETDLKQVLRSGQALTEEHIKFFIYQALRALHVIHSAGVIHRDITPANILVNSNCDLKICDFGLAKEESDHGEYMTDYVTMRWYRAPELVMEDKNYSAKIDVGNRVHPGGASGVSASLDKIVEVTGTPPEEDIDTVGSTAARKYLKKKTPYPPPDWRRKYPNASKEAIDLLQRMLVFHPHKRISVLEAMRHPFLKNLHEDSDDVVNVPPFRYEEPNHKNVHEVKRAIYNASVRLPLAAGRPVSLLKGMEGPPSRVLNRRISTMRRLTTPLFATLSSNLLFSSDLLLLVPTSKTISHHSLGLHSNMQLRQGRFFPLPQVHLSDNTHIQFLTCEVYTNKRKTRETNSIDTLIFNILELTLQQEVLRARGKLTTTMSTMKCYVSEIFSVRQYNLYMISVLTQIINLFFITTIVLESYLRCSGRNDSHQIHVLVMRASPLHCRCLRRGVCVVCVENFDVSWAPSTTRRFLAFFPCALQRQKQKQPRGTRGGGDEKWGQTALEYIYQQNHTVDPGKRQHDVASERRASTAFDRLLSVNETVLELRMGRLAERMTEALEVLQQLGLQETLDEATMLNGEQPPANYRRPSLTPPLPGYEPGFGMDVPQLKSQQMEYPPVTRLTDPLEFSGAATTFPYVPPHEVEDLTHNTAQLLERQSGELREAAPTTGVEGEGFAARLALEQKALARQALILELAADPSFKESYNSDEALSELDMNGLILPMNPHSTHFAIDQSEQTSNNNNNNNKKILQRITLIIFIGYSISTTEPHFFFVCFPCFRLTNSFRLSLKKDLMTFSCLSFCQRCSLSRGFGAVSVGVRHQSTIGGIHDEGYYAYFPPDTEGFFPPSETMSHQCPRQNKKTQPFPTTNASPPPMGCPNDFVCALSHTFWVSPVLEDSGNLWQWRTAVVHGADGGGTARETYCLVPFLLSPGTIVPTSAPIISDTVIQRLTGRLRRHKESRSDLLTLPTRIRLVVPSAIGSLHPCIAASNPRLDPVQDVDPSPALWASSYFDLLDLRGEWERRREKASTPSSFREQLVRNGWAVQVESREPPSSAPAGCPTLQAAIRSIPEKLEGETSKQYAERCWMRFQNAVGDHPCLAKNFSPALILALDRYAALIARGELSVPAACWALLCDSSSSDVVVYIRSHAVDLEKEVTATALAHEHFTTMVLKRHRTLLSSNMLSHFISYTLFDLLMVKVSLVTHSLLFLLKKKQKNSTALHFVLFFWVLMAQLFVGQLPFNKFYPDDLIHLFRPFGVVVAHELYIRTGSGFVTFATTDEADAAISALHNKKVVEGRVQPLQVMYSKGSKLISPFGRQHRTMCCSKEQRSGSPNTRKGKAAAAHQASATSDTATPLAATPGFVPVGSPHPLLPLCVAPNTVAGATPLYSVVYVMGAMPPPLAAPLCPPYPFTTAPFLSADPQLMPVMVYLLNRGTKTGKRGRKTCSLFFLLSFRFMPQQTPTRDKKQHTAGNGKETVIVFMLIHVSSISLLQTLRRQLTVFLAAQYDVACFDLSALNFIPLQPFIYYIFYFFVLDVEIYGNTNHAAAKRNEVKAAVRSTLIPRAKNSYAKSQLQQPLQQSSSGHHLQ
eukprot:gene4459-3254_t